MNYDAISRALLCALLLSLLSACGGSKSSADEEKGGFVFEPAASESLVSENATLARAAALNSASLEAAEQRALAAEDRSGSTGLDQLQPGQPAPKSAYASGDIARKAQAVGITAYRFYNGSTGAHFYTVSEAERDNVRNNLSPPYNYEGEAFRVANTYAPGLSPVHRFYNTRNGVHFYTISEAERAHVAATLPHYTYEGVAYHASEVAGANLTPFHRFYVPSKGFHFYTASEEEKNQIIANLGATYRYEGVGYYVLDTLWNAEKLPHTGVTSAQCYEAGKDTLQDCFTNATRDFSQLQDGFIGALGLVRMDYGPVARPGGGAPFDLTECVQDKVTGLIWEGKNAQSTQPRWGGATFTNLGNGAANDVSGHVAAVNASRLCGFSDWRVPSRLELLGIVHFGKAPPLVDPLFANTQSQTYWARDIETGSPNFAWGMYFGSGESLVQQRSVPFPVRLVRGNPPGGTSPRFSYITLDYPGDAAFNGVHDAWTGLQWRRCEMGRVWNGTTCTGDPHENALILARQKAGWRLPNIKELSSLIDLGRSVGDRIDPIAFPGASGAPLWATTPLLSRTSWASNLNTSDGQVSFANRGTALGVRLLRDNYFH